MNNHRNTASILSGYRVLDLADEKGVLCSRLLANMGAEVTSIHTKACSQPSIKRTQFFIEVEDSESSKKYKYPGAPCKLSRSPW